MRDLTEDGYSNETSSSSKKGSVKKLMKATSKLFSASPSKKTSSFKAKQSPLKRSKDDLVPSVSVNEIASRWESGDVHGSNSKQT